MKISKYGTFGIHQEWVDMFLTSPETFWDDKLLGVKQIPSFKTWLKDAGIIDEAAKLTAFGELCMEINQENETVLWELIYINLANNSPLMRWFCASVDFNNEIDRKDLDRMALEYFQQSFKESTIKYAVQALMQTFKYSPIGEEFMQLASQEGKGTGYKRQPYDDLSTEAVAYSLYIYGKQKGIRMFRVSDLYRPEEDYGMYREFGINQSELLKKLRSLSAHSDRVLVAELNMGLDHITLREDLDEVSVLKHLFA